MIFFLILLFFLIQFLFGVGLLLFGTSTFLLMGYSYEDTLVILLPPSIMISFIQTFLGFNLVDTKKLIFVYSIPMVVLGLILVLNFGEDFKLETIVGIMLLAIVFIRASKKTKNYINMFVNKYIKISSCLTRYPASQLDLQPACQIFIPSWLARHPVGEPENDIQPVGHISSWPWPSSPLAQHCAQVRSKH